MGVKRSVARPKTHFKKLFSIPKTIIYIFGVKFDVLELILICQFFGSKKIKFGADIFENVFDDIYL